LTGVGSLQSRSKSDRRAAGYGNLILGQITRKAHAVGKAQVSDQASEAVQHRAIPDDHDFDLPPKHV
jgi:hypothetical protein